jgi:hypothetical protein
MLQCQEQSNKRAQEQLFVAVELFLSVTTIPNVTVSRTEQQASTRAADCCSRAVSLGNDYTQCYSLKYIIFMCNTAAFTANVTLFVYHIFRNGLGDFYKRN